MKTIFFALSILFASIVTNLAQTPDPVVFSLNSEDVGKVVILMFKPNRILLEITYSKEKQAELLKLTTDNIQKKLKIILNGKTVAERMITEPATGHSFKVEMSSPDEAFEMAGTIFKAVAKPTEKTP